MMQYCTMAPTYNNNMIRPPNVISPPVRRVQRNMPPMMPQSTGTAHTHTHTNSNEYLGVFAPRNVAPLPKQAAQQAAPIRVCIVQRIVVDILLNIITYIDSNGNCSTICTNSWLVGIPSCDTNESNYWCKR
jgi:hypothetical protein